MTGSAKSGAGLTTVSPDCAALHPGYRSSLAQSPLALRVILVFGILSRLDRGGQQRNGPVLLWNIHRLVVRVLRDLQGRGFVDEGVFRNEARLGIRNVMAENRFSRRPFLVLIRLRP